MSVDEPLGKHSAPSACAPRVKDDDEKGLKKARKVRRTVSVRAKDSHCTWHSTIFAVLL